MKEKEKSSLINKLLEVNKIEQNENLQSDPSFFDIIGRAYDEDLISRILAYVLKNDRMFVWNLFKFCGILVSENCPTEFEVLSVECEKAMYNGRVDIFVIAHYNDETFTLTIENKIYSWEHDDQTQTYYDFVSQHYRQEEKGKRNAYLFLKPNFNASPISCDKFTPIDYDALVEKISKTDDYRINDFKRHIKEFLIMSDIELTDLDRQVLKHLKDLREILNSTEIKVLNFKRQLFNDLCRKGGIKDFEFNPYEYKAKKKDEKDAYWNKFKGNKELVAEIVDNEASFKIYKADEWYHYEDGNGYYFYVELIFVDNNPNEILVQEVIKRYGNMPKLIKFIGNRDFGISAENRKLEWTEQFFVVTSKKFISDKELLSKEWRDELFDFARRNLSDYIEEMNIIFDKFKGMSKNIG